MGTRYKHRVSHLQGYLSSALPAHLPGVLDASRDRSSWGNQKRMVGSLCPFCLFAPTMDLTVPGPINHSDCSLNSLVPTWSIWGVSPSTAPSYRIQKRHEIILGVSRVPLQTRDLVGCTTQLQVLNTKHPWLIWPLQKKKKSILRDRSRPADSKLQYILKMKASMTSMAPMARTCSRSLEWRKGYFQGRDCIKYEP